MAGRPARPVGRKAGVSVDPPSTGQNNAGRSVGDRTARLWHATGDLLDEIPAVGAWSRAVALDATGTRVAVGLGIGMITAHTHGDRLDSG